MNRAFWRLFSWLPAVAFALSLLFVPFRHRTLVSTPEGGFDFREELVWAPLWRQPSFDSGVAEYPFRWLMGAWGALLVAGVGVWVWRRRAVSSPEATP